MAGRTIIVGGGGFARELYHWASDCASAGTIPPIGGYVDDAGDVLFNRAAYAMPYLGTIDQVVIAPDDRFVLAIGSPRTKRILQARIAERGGRFATLVHPSCLITPTATVEEGALLCPGCIIGVDSTIERFATLNTGSGTGHDARVGAFAVLASRVAISGYAIVGEDASVGSGVVLLPNVKVGAGALVGPGCILYRSVPAGVTVFAPPAKQLRLKKG